MHQAHRRTMLPTRALWIALALTAAAAQAVSGAPRPAALPAPLQTAGAARDGLVPLRIDPAAAGVLRARGGGRVALPVSPDRVVAAELERIEVFAPDAQVVVVSDDGPRRIVLPRVDLYAGHVVGEPDSFVFLSLGATVQGLVEFSAGDRR